MKIQYRKGDLLQSGLRFVGHGCNSQRVMGSGIAWQIKQCLPYAYTTYMHSDMSLGSVNVAVGNGPVVFNCITQERFGRNPNVVYCDYNAIRKCIKTIDRIVGDIDPGAEVGLPKIGAGLANGDWSVIEKIIEEESTHFQPVVYTLD